MPATADAVYVDCPSCEQHGRHAMPAAGAEQLAGLHDELHYRGEPTAILRRVGRDAATQRADR